MLAKLPNRDGIPGTSVPLQIVAGHPALLERLFQQARGTAWALALEDFAGALERSAQKRFGSTCPAAADLEEYLSALHLEDLALACACAQGQAAAWDYFVVGFREYLRSAAAAILRCPAGSPEARDLADSLFAELYGLPSANQSRRSLFRYFHGRSSLKTWLRAVLAQRHIDAIRASRRFTELDDATPSVGHAESAPNSQHSSPVDPHRERYATLFCQSLQIALHSLPSDDRNRLLLYYAEEKTLAEIGRLLGEHESTVSRQLDRTRRELRRDVEAALRKSGSTTDGLSSNVGLSDAEIALCFEYATEIGAASPLDFDRLSPDRADQKLPAERERREP